MKHVLCSGQGFMLHQDGADKWKNMAEVGFREALFKKFIHQIVTSAFGFFSQRKASSFQYPANLKSQGSYPQVSWSSNKFLLSMWGRCWAQESEAEWKPHGPCLQGFSSQWEKMLSTGAEPDRNGWWQGLSMLDTHLGPRPTSSGHLQHLVHFALWTLSPWPHMLSRNLFEDQLTCGSAILLFFKWR